MRQARQSLDATKKRVTESEKRIDTQLEPFIKKNYWCAPRASWMRRARGGVHALARICRRRTWADVCPSDHPQCPCYALYFLG